MAIFERFAWTGALAPDPVLADVRAVAEAFDVPILLSSFSYRAEVEGLNDFPPLTIFDVLPSQQDRADRDGSYMAAALQIPQVVGAHWWAHSDQPPEGRYDGENCNFGIVDIADTSYEALVERMGLVARDLYRG